MLRHSRGAGHGARAARRWAALASLGVACATLGACSDDYFEETTGPERYGYGASPNAAFGAPLFGCWSRVDAGGTGVLDQTAWSFGTDGTGSRTLVRRALGGQTLGAEQARFTWRPSGNGLVLIQFAPGSVGFGTSILQLPYRVDGGFGAPTLQLDGFSFVSGC
jgi:hypothetical protein